MKITNKDIYIIILMVGVFLCDVWWQDMLMLIFQLTVLFLADRE